MELRMTLIEHLEELRKRLLISIAAILVAAMAAFFLSDRILSLLMVPSGLIHLNAFGLMDGFFIKWRIAFFTGIVIAFPIWAEQLYQFVGPGLFASERKIVFPLLFGSLFLFALGVAFGYYLLWGMIRVLMQLFPPQVSLLPSADSYISFVIFFLLSCGLAFQLPTGLLLLVQLRILSTEMMRKHRRVAYFALFAFAELITPVSDPIIAPLTVMLPLVILYEGSILLAARVERGRKQAETPSS